MNHVNQRWTAAILMASILGLMGLLDLPLSAAPAAPRPLQGGEEPPEERPCGIVFDRTVDPRVVKQGDYITVRVHYDYKCVQRTRKVNVILTVADTLSQDVNPRDGVSILGQLKRGLKDFANRINYSNGSCVGLIVFAATAQPLMPLHCGPDARDEILNRIDNNIRLKPTGAVAGMGEAVRDATQQLPVDDPLADNLIVVFDSGAPETTGAEERIPVPLSQACKVAKASQVSIAGVQMAMAQGRLWAAGCITQGLWTVRDDAGKDMQDVWNAAAEALLYGDKMNEATYCDYINRQLFEYVPGSANPRDPDVDDPFSGICWTFKAGTHRVGGQTIEYQVKVKDDDPTLAGQKTELGDEADLYFEFQSGNRLDYFLPNPLVCIYRPGKQDQDCKNFPPVDAPTTTPEVPTATPGMGETPTDVPTVVVPTDPPASPTATDPPTQPSATSPSPTDGPQVERIFLPWLTRPE